MMNKKYNIIQDLIPICSQSPRRRSGYKIDKVMFLVAHDTGNDNSTAKGNVNYFKETYNQISASAHIFVDDKEIIECIPAFEKPEKAWHVLQSKEKDNEMYGADANDCAIGVELCYSNSYDPNNSKINNIESYRRYVWTFAYLCCIYNLNPKIHIVGHYILDPTRRTDPMNAFKYLNKTWNNFINDVYVEYLELKNDGFKDTINHWAKADIQDISTLGIMSGYTDKTFKPNNNITRAEVAVVIYRTIKLIFKVLNINLEEILKKYKEKE